MASKTPQDIITECVSLQKSWQSVRNVKFQDWYGLLTQRDDFQEDNMESFVSNEPRTFYNLSRHLLCGKVPHRIPRTEIDELDFKPAADIEKMLTKAWQDNDKTEFRRGKQSWLWNFVSLMLATGWYAVFVLVTDKTKDQPSRCIAEVWNPAEVFPELGDELYSVARIYKLTRTAAIRKIVSNNWKVDTKNIPAGGLTFYNYWWIDPETLTVMNAVVAGTDFAKPPTEEKFKHIPVLVSPVGGLPDTGVITTGNDWQGQLGESILATNEKTYKSYNKQWTFLMQLLRDTAQPRWFERSRGNQAILKEEDIFKRGAIFRGAPEDSVDLLATPPIPIELRTMSFDMQNSMQRGSLSWALYGNLQGQITSYVMSQISASARQSLDPYHKAIMYALAGIDNEWLEQCELFGLNPYDVKLPKVKPTYVVSADYDIQIPGDLTQRATVAKMLDPDYSLSHSTITSTIFPEIKDPLQEQAQYRKDEAMKNPVSIIVNLITAYRQQAMLLRQSRDVTGMADLYDKAATALEKQLSPEGQAGTGAPPLKAKMPRPEAAGPTVEMP